MSQVQVARPTAGGRCTGAVRRGGGGSRGVLVPRGFGSGRDGLHAEHEAATAGRALIQRLAGELLETVAVDGRRVSHGLGRRPPQRPSAQGELGLAVTVMGWFSRVGQVDRGCELYGVSSNERSA